MRRSLSLAVLVALLTTVPTTAQAGANSEDRAELDDARVIVQAVVPEAQRTASLQQVMKVVGTQMVQSGLIDMKDPVMAKMFEEFMADLPVRLQPAIDAFGSDMADAMAQAYIREFSASELREIRKFAESSAGMHYLGASMKMVEDPAVAAANKRFLATLPEALDQIMADWDRQAKTYLAKKRASNGDGETRTMIVNNPPPAPPAPPTVAAPPAPPR